MDNIIHLDAFDQNYQMAIVFSLFEGLRDGELLKIKCKSKPNEIINLLNESNMPNLHTQASEGDHGNWILQIQKAKSIGNNESCCGMCKI